ncbi:MAG: SDR family NAD(P)-dependent oxidoreductase [Cyanobacteria bacterium P01_C01_bin.121]
MAMRLNQKVALITSSQRGTCATTARLLAQAGARVMICGRNATQGQATVTEIQNNGGRASFVLADVASAADVQAAIDETIATYGRLDILFNCASRPHTHDSPLTDVSEAAWDRIVEVTLKGTFFCCQYALPFLQNSDEGIIINLIEQAEPPQAHAVTSTCHGGILSLTQAIAHQFSTHNVVANLIWLSPEPVIANPLTTEKILYAPHPATAEAASTDPDSTDPDSSGTSSTDAAFSTVADAIMYLASYDPQVCGYTLVVSQP